jgi:lysozyme
MKISQTGIDLIKSFEGYRSEAYQCSAGKWTIGYGHTNSVLPLQKTTPEQAEKFLLDDLADAVSAVNRLVKVELSQAQFDALVSLVFNIGAGAFASSTLLQKLNAKDYYGAREQFKRWNKAGGKVLVGLTRRRAAEAELFMPSIEKPLTKSSSIQVGAGATALGGGTLTAVILEQVAPALPVVREAASVAREIGVMGVLTIGGCVLMGLGIWYIWKRIKDRKKGIK